MPLTGSAAALISQLILSSKINALPFDPPSHLRSNERSMEDTGARLKDVPPQTYEKTHPLEVL